MSSKVVKSLIVLLFLLAVTIPSSAQTAPSEAGIPPFPGAPLCPTHNDTQYHGLWDDVRGCHYDHTHGDNPALADGIFGVAGRDWGQVISYPFMTDKENAPVGHTGYKYYVNLAPQPACARESFEYLGNVNCVSAFRIQYHDVGGSAHMVKRFHSYYLEAQVKKGNIVGYIRTGGWADFGCLHGSYKDFFIVLPGIDPTNSTGQSVCGNEQDLNEDPYRNASTVAESLQSARFNSDNFWSWTSTTASVYGYNKLGGFFYRVLDASGGMDAADPPKEYPICPDFKCKYNNSEQHVYTVMIIIPASLDTDRDGIVNYTGYTDRKGNIVQGCTSPSLDCVPLQIVNAPVGQALWARNLSGPRPAGDPVRDYDIYFNGQPSGWIQSNSLPNYSPTSTPISSGAFVSTELNPAYLSIGATGLVTVRLTNVPVEGYKSAEFTCTYNAGLVEKSNIVATSLFGSDSAAVINDPQNGTFIVAIAGTNGNKATTSGPAFTFSVRGLQAGQSPIQCTARVSKGDNMPMDLPSTGANLTIGAEPSPTPFGIPTATSGDNQPPTATNVPIESPTPTASFTPLPSPDGSLTGQVIASKPVTVSLLDANNVAVTLVATNPDGTFSITALAGNYTVVATASGFLSQQGSAILTAGNTTARPTVNLLAGDIDGNNVIDQFDALTVGMSYNTATPSSADLNNDGTIDFLDLELLADNYRKMGPAVWQ